MSTENGLQVRRRRGWSVTAALPELNDLPTGLVLDYELVAFNADGDPDRPPLCHRVLDGNSNIRSSW